MNANVSDDNSSASDRTMRVSSQNNGTASIQDASSPTRGGIVGLFNNAKRMTMEYGSWAFRSGSTVSWALSITSLIIVLPLILEVRWDFALADQEKYFELQQKGYTHQQIEQMMGRTIPTGPPAAA